MLRKAVQLGMCKGSGRKNSEDGGGHDGILSPSAIHRGLSLPTPSFTRALLHVPLSSSAHLDHVAAATAGQAGPRPRSASQRGSVVDGGGGGAAGGTGGTIAGNGVLAPLVNVAQKAHLSPAGLHKVNATPMHRCASCTETERGGGG